MILDGLPMTRLHDMARIHGVLLIFVRAEDESTDSEIQLRTPTGGETGITVQLSGRFYTATEWLAAENAVWFGIERTDINAAMMDALARFTSRN